MFGAYGKDDKTKFVVRTGARDDCLKAAEAKKAKADAIAQRMRQFIEDCGISPDAPVSSLKVPDWALCTDAFRTFHHLAGYNRTAQEGSLGWPNGVGPWVDKLLYCACMRLFVRLAGGP